MMITRNVDANEEKRALGAGADDFFSYAVQADIDAALRRLEHRVQRALLERGGGLELAAFP